MKIAFLTLLFFSALPAHAQEADFEAFLKSFPKRKLPYLCEVKSSYKKKHPISQTEAKNFFTGFKNTDNHEVNHYEALIEPFMPSKDEEGREFASEATAYKVALLQRTEKYVLVLTRVVALQKGFENMESEQFLLHSFSITGEPIQVLPIAQKVQFDLHSNEIRGKVEANGSIWTRVQVHTISGTEERIERYQIQPNGIIQELKE
jgi:hypothetical protein